MTKTYKNIKDLFKDLEKDIKKNPNKYLDEQAKKNLVGKKVTGLCPECNAEREVEILRQGKVRCSECDNEFNLEINWDVK